ncbi:putative cruciform cutting endonuclease [Triangularia verruculosa]|uniref:Cruciform cutting endonuclease n=1 Tax=Triangularia verruculosa TaxID=2587418 RepID=A0AAN6XQE5_9PEZI|nr:putative cruciform cutting endonuclease [Triangularia verruculosa]
MTSSKLALPGKITVAHLQALCLSTGLPQAGSKSVIQQTLRQAAQSVQHIPDSARILSIDLGIKNFAFSLLTPAPSPSKKTPIPAPSVTETQPQALLPPVNLHHWNHLDLTTPLFSLPPQDGSTSPGPEPIEFNPSSLSSLTYSLISTYLLPLKPTHILIERQRFRTGNASNIFEWTIRVNTLEAMLHASFATLKGLDLFKGTVISISPKTLARYLFPNTKSDDPEPETGKRKILNPYNLLKTNKVSMLGDWLQQGQLIKPKEQAADMARTFLQAWQAKGIRGKKKEIEGILGQGVKLDDLSDSVLQGMVWLQWQRNLEELKGVDFGEGEGKNAEKAVEKVKSGAKRIKGVDVKDNEDGPVEVDAILEEASGKKKGGRKKKTQSQEETDGEVILETPKKRRSRPKKSEVLPKAVEEEQASTKKPPGRPKKTTSQQDDGDPVALEAEVQKKGRGRPKKAVIQDESAMEEAKVDSNERISSRSEPDEEEEAVLI